MDKKIEALREKMNHVNDVEKPIEKSLDDKPSVAGRYNITIKNVRSMLPMFLNFDGENWTDLSFAKTLAGDNLSNITYFDRPMAQVKFKF
jgi:hypothetical protein